ncbi:hypothetical protein BH11PSE9_BH11PSE9_34590 [soil metagenome]
MKDAKAAGSADDARVAGVPAGGVAPPRLSRSLPQVYAAAALRLLLPLVVLPLMASRVGADEFGRLSFILVWAGLLAMIVEGGFLAAATRLAVAADAPRRWQLAQQVFTARCVLCVPAVLLAVVAVLWADPQAVAATGPLAHSPAQSMVETHAGIDTLAIAALACALGWPATWYLQATHQLNRWARVELAVYGALLLLCWPLARSVEAYLLLQLGASTALAVLGWRWLKRDLGAIGDLAEAASGSKLPGSRSPGSRSTSSGSTNSTAHASLWAPRQLRAGLKLGWTMMPVSIAGAAYSFALPAAASSQLPKAELGLYFMADRIVRAVLGAADPVFSVVYPRIVGLFAQSSRAALVYSARWALAGLIAGTTMFAAGALMWPWLVAVGTSRFGALDPARLHDVLQILGWLLPLLLGWKFFGYWMLGSGRFDTAYRSCVSVCGIVGTALALTLGGAAGAVGLAWTALGVESVVIAVAVTGVLLTRRLRSRT